MKKNEKKLKKVKKIKKSLPKGGGFNVVTGSAGGRAH